MATTGELRRWCFGGDSPAEAGASLPDAFIFRVMAYRFAPKNHPEYRDDYMRSAMIDLPLSVEFKRLAAAFRKAGVRFAPIKGADLAERCYPESALRPRCDIDIIVHEEDIDRAVKIAEGEGWRAAHQYQHDSHCPSMYKKNAMLELHFNLPDMPSECNPRVWAVLVARDGSSEYRLPPELALTVAFHHARNHRWANGAVLIADYAFLLKTFRGFDWKLAREYAENFGVADPAVLCFALPELFPPEVMPPAPPPPEDLCRALREAVLSPIDFEREDRGGAVMNSGDRFSWPWWKARLRGFSPSSVRMNYRISDDAGFLRMAAAYFRMFGDKMKLAWRGVRDEDDGFTRALRRAEKIERALSKPGK